MTGNELGHFKHSDLLLAEDRHELIIGEDVPLILRVLKFMLLDVIPHSFDHLPTRVRT